MPSLSGFLSTRVVGPTPFFLISSEHLVVRMKVPDSALPSGWASHFQASAVAGIKLPQGQCTAPSEPDVGNSSESTPGLLSSNGFWIRGVGVRGDVPYDHLPEVSAICHTCPSTQTACGSPKGHLGHLGYHQTVSFSFSTWWGMEMTWLL